MRLRGSPRNKVFGSDKNLILKSNASRVFKSLVGNKDRSTLSFSCKKAYVSEIRLRTGNDSRVFMLMKFHFKK